MAARVIDAVYENGVIRPLKPLKGLAEHTRLRVTIEETPSHPLSECVGVLSDEDAAEMKRIIEEEFEQVTEDEWK
ncbi:MAG: antitoxin family protein [Fimbriimonadales bacterium]|nr:antitoxin family protein [Fimbriimonadales bacterium]